MRDRIDELFDTERLRASWIGKDQVPTEEKESQHPSPDTGNISALYDRLCKLIQGRFPGEEGTALNVMLSELDELLTLRYPRTEGSTVTKEEKTVLNLAIEKVLCEIEDLIEALELGRRKL